MFFLNYSRILPVLFPIFFTFVLYLHKENTIYCKDSGIGLDKRRFSGNLAT